MNTKRNRRRALTLGAAAVGAAVPALLLAGATGTANAAISDVNASSTGYYGVNVVIQSDKFNPSSGTCTYSSEPVLGSTDPGQLSPLPVYNVPFQLSPGGSQTLWFAGTATGTLWDTVITCSDGSSYYEQLSW